MSIIKYIFSAILLVVVYITGALPPTIWDYCSSNDQVAFIAIVFFATIIICGTHLYLGLKYLLSGAKTTISFGQL